MFPWSNFESRKMLLCHPNPAVNYGKGELGDLKSGPLSLIINMDYQKDLDPEQLLDKYTYNFWVDIHELDPSVPL